MNYRSKYSPWCGVLAVMVLVLAGAVRLRAQTTIPTTQTQPASAPALKPVAKSKLPALSPALWQHIDAASVRREVETIYALGSRVVGQPGHAKVRDYVRAELKRLGVETLEQPITLTVPVDVGGDEPVQAGVATTLPDAKNAGATLQLAGQKYGVYAVWPNLVMASYIPAPGLNAPLVEGGNGELSDLDGKTIQDAIVVLNFNSGKNWENAAKLGAAAVLFRHPKTTSNFESNRKFFNVPLNVPRFLLSPEATNAVDAVLKGSASVPAQLVGGARWTKVQTSNIVAIIPPAKQDDASAGLLLVQCYLDSMMIAPAGPHGADSSLQLIAGLNLIRGMMAEPSSRPGHAVAVVFSDGHCLGLAGANEFGYLLSQGFNQTGVQALEDEAARMQGSARALELALRFLSSDGNAGLIASRNVYGQGMDASKLLLDPQSMDIIRAGLKQYPEAIKNARLQADKNETDRLKTIADGQVEIEKIKNKLGQELLPQLNKLDDQRLDLEAQRREAMRTLRLLRAGLDSQTSNPRIDEFTKQVSELDLKLDELVKVSSPLRREVTASTKKVATLDKQFKAANSAQEEVAAQRTYLDTVTVWTEQLLAKTDDEARVFMLLDGLPMAGSNAERQFGRTLPLLSMHAAADVMTRATQELKTQIDDLSQRGRIKTARVIQPISKKDPTKANELAQLSKIRDWYQLIDRGENRADIVTRVGIVRRGPEWLTTSDPEQYRALLFSIQGLQQKIENLAREQVVKTLSAQQGQVLLQKLVKASAGGRVWSLSLELSAGADQLSWDTVKGYGFNRRADFFRDMMGVQREGVAELAKLIGLKQAIPLEDAFSIEAGEIRGLSTVNTVTEGNATYLAGITSYALASINVTRSLVDTPLDTPETVDEAKAAESMKFLAGFINLLTRQPSLVRMDNDIKGGAVEVSGRVVEFDVLAGVFPNQPVPGSLVLFPQNFLNQGSRETVSTNAGVRRMALTTVDTNGRYRIRGIPDRRAITTKQDVEIFAFHFGLDGKIDYTVDRSPHGTDMLSNRLTRRFDREDVSIVTAPMRGLAIFDLLDPRVLTPLVEIKLLNAASLSRPDHSALFLPNSLIPGDNGPYTENCGVIYGPVDANMVALVNQGLSGTRATLINTEAGSSNAHIGFSTNAPGGRINATALRIAADLVAVNHDRLAKLSKYGIQNTLLNDLDKQARASLDEAQKALVNREYSRAYRAGTHAWGVALRAYPDVRSLGKDAVIASVFFLALVLPFAFFIERLTIRAKNPNLRVIWTLVIFLALFGLMWCIHPAFAIALSPMIVLLAFVMIILMLVVTSIIYRKFVNLIKEYRSQLEGVHGADLKRFSASGVALNLSLSTMARRKARTLLTGATLTMLAFAIVTFSSINSSISFRQTPIAKVTPAYNGLLFHTPQWTDIPVSVIDGFVNEFGLDHTVLTRVWKLKTQDAWRLGNPANTRISIRQVDTMGRAIGKQTGYVRGLIGVVPEEAKVFPPEKMLAAGHWLRAGYPDDAVIAPAVAESLGIKPADLDTPKARVGMFDQTFMVVGILNIAGANAWRDLDGSTTAPVDFAAAGGDGAQSRDIANLGTFDPNNRLPQLPMDEMIFVPAARALRMEGTVKSVAVRFADQANAAELMNRLMTRLKVPVFAGVDGKAVLYESVDTSSVEGIGRLVVPILLAIFMIVNTLLGTVEERKDEIAMLNSVGLAPAHVGMLFLVEAVVYGVLGLVIGYLIGLGLAYVLLGNQGLREAVGAANMSLNYSSGSTVLSCVMVLVIVVLSALYPASQARKLATPGNMASWSLPPSEDGTLAVEVPFTLTGGNALGMLGFLDEYLASHHESTSPDFRVMWRQFMEVTGPSGRELRLEGEAFLAPYDLGVAEKFGVAIWQTKEATIFRVRFDIARTAGEMSSFRRATQIFLDHLRQQFLIWRTLSTEDKQKYVQRTIQGYKTGTASVA
jgi:hypothetical protein